MKMARHLRRATAGLAVLVLAACGSTDAPGAAAPGGQSGAPSGDGETVRMAFIPQIVGIPYYAGFEQGAQKAAEEFGVEVVGPGGVECEGAVGADA